MELRHLKQRHQEIIQTLNDPAFNGEKQELIDEIKRINKRINLEEFDKDKKGRPIDSSKKWWQF